MRSAATAAAPKIALFTSRVLRRRDGMPTLASHTHDTACGAKGPGAATRFCCDNAPERGPGLARASPARGPHRRDSSTIERSASLRVLPGSPPLLRLDRAASEAEVARHLATRSASSLPGALVEHRCRHLARTALAALAAAPHAGARRSADAGPLSRPAHDEVRVASPARRARGDRGPARRPDIWEASRRRTWSFDLSSRASTSSPWTRAPRTRRASRACGAGAPCAALRAPGDTRGSWAPAAPAACCSSTARRRWERDDGAAHRDRGGGGGRHREGDFALRPGCSRRSAKLLVHSRTMTGSALSTFGTRHGTSVDAGAGGPARAAARPGPLFARPGHRHQSGQCDGAVDLPRRRRARTVGPYGH